MIGLSTFIFTYGISLSEHDRMRRVRFHACTLMY